MHRSLGAVLGLTLVLLMQSLPIASADLANPPQLLGVQVDNSRAYKSGENIVIDVLYAGGNPGLQNVEIFLRHQDKTGSVDFSRCFALGPWNASEPKYQNGDYGNIRPGLIRFRASVTSNCYPGANQFLAYVELADKTGLRTNKSFPFIIKITSSKNEENN